MSLKNRLDDMMIQFMAHHSARIIRITLSIVFLWFGMLKVIGVSPVADLVARVVPWFPPEHFIPILGVWEMVVGFGLMLGIALRFTLFLFWLLLAGTFSVLVFEPNLTFQQGNPLLLTFEGEFIVKNLVLISAGLVIGGTLDHTHRKG